MTNPLVLVRTETIFGQEQPLGRGLYIWCPGCKAAHRPRAANEDGSTPDPTRPYWDWNGATDETFTISPSLLCHLSVHLCEGEHPPAVCPDPDSCGETGHLILNEDGTSHRIDQPEPAERILGHNTPHTRDPAWGGCHSFIRDGHWQFLGDCAHALANQTVPMVPVPDWMIR